MTNFSKEKKEKLKREKEMILFFVGLHLFIFALGSLFAFISGDTFVYFFYGSAILQGKIPYRDFYAAYPPFSLLIFLLPRIFTSNFPFYAFLFNLEMFFINLICLFFIIKLAKDLNFPLENTLIIYTLCLFFLFPIVGTRYDLFPAFLTFLAFYAFFRGWNKVCWIALAAGILAKIYPIFLVPLFTAFQLQKKDYKGFFEGCLILFLFLGVPWIIFTPEGVISLLKGQLERPLQIETLASSFLLVGNFFGLWSLRKEIRNSINVRSLAADFIAKHSPLFLLFSLFLLYWFYFQNLKRYFQTKESNQPFLLAFPLVNYLSATILVTILLSKVFSPQFLLWLSPFIPFIQGRWRKVSIPIFIFACLLTTVIWPFNYYGLFNGEPFPIFVLLIRNLLLVVVVYLLVKEKSLGFLSKKINLENVSSTESQEKYKSYYRYVEDYDWVEIVEKIKGPETFYHRKRLRETLALIKHFGKGERYLDAGCGTGLVLRNLPKEAVGLDINPRHLKKAKKYVPWAKLIEGDIENMPFPDNFFSTVIATEVLEHSPHPSRVLSEIKRVMEPGGILIGSVPCSSWIWKFRFLSRTCPRQEPFHKYYTKKELEELLSKYFKIIKLYPAVWGMNLFFVCQKS